MNIKKILIVIINILIMFSCVEEYMPLIDTKDVNQYVVNGNITNVEGYQIVIISKSTSILSQVIIPAYNPVSNCKITISDDKGNDFELNEEIDKPGEYKVWIDQEFLNIGTSYKIFIRTPEGIEISSEYDKITDCADIDSLFFIEENIPTSDQDEPIEGMQYYTNLSGENDQSRFYKYIIEETWEYHVRHYNHGSIDVDGTVTLIDPPDRSKQICWKTQFFPEIFILSTKDLSENKFKKLPLHHVTSTTERLEYGYSVLLKQYSLTEDAFNYWQKVKNNFINNTGLYNQQPELIRGNLYNLSNPNSEILGYFYASTVKTKRIFTKKKPGQILFYHDHCGEHELRFGANSVHPTDRPAYLYYNGLAFTSWLSDGCVDCTLQGGETTKPDFWPY